MMWIASNVACYGCGDGGGSSGQDELRFQIFFFEETSIVSDESHDRRDRAARVGDADAIVGMSRKGEGRKIAAAQRRFSSFEAPVVWTLK